MKLEKVIQRDFDVFGEDVVTDVYKNFFVLVEKFTPTITSQAYMNQINSEPGAIAKIFGRIGEMFSNKKAEMVANAAKDTAGAAETVASSGILSKVFGLLKGGITSIFSPANLPKVLATAGGAALIGLLIKALRNRKKKNKALDEAYELIKDSEQMMIAEETLGFKNFKYFNY